MLVLISLVPLLLCLSLFNKKDSESTAKEKATASEKTIERRRQRARQRARELALRQQQESKAPDVCKVLAFIKGLRDRLRPNSDISLTDVDVMQARMLLALSTFLHEQRTGCSYHDGLLNEIYRDLIGYAVIPNCNIIREIVRISHGNMLSIGSGKAALEACMLPHMGKRIIFCTDISPDSNPFMSVIKMDSVSAVTSLGNVSDTCLICWPDLDDSHTLVALQSREEPFPCIIYVGEPRGGCCANDEFFDYLETNYEVKKRIEIRGFLNDASFIYHSKF
jgi:hypothetical protein